MKVKWSQSRSCFYAIPSSKLQTYIKCEYVESDVGSSDNVSSLSPSQLFLSNQFSHLNVNDGGCSSSGWEETDNKNICCSTTNSSEVLENDCETPGGSETTTTTTFVKIEFKEEVLEPGSGDGEVGAGSAELASSPHLGEQQGIVDATQSSELVFTQQLHHQQVLHHSSLSGVPQPSPLLPHFLETQQGSPYRHPQPQLGGFAQGVEEVPSSSGQFNLQQQQSSAQSPHQLHQQEDERLFYRHQDQQQVGGEMGNLAQRRRILTARRDNVVASSPEPLSPQSRANNQNQPSNTPPTASASHFLVNSPSSTSSTGSALNDDGYIGPFGKKLKVSRERMKSGDSAGDSSGSTGSKLRDPELQAYMDKPFYDPPPLAPVAKSSSSGRKGSKGPRKAALSKSLTPTKGSPHKRLNRRCHSQSVVTEPLNLSVSAQGGSTSKAGPASAPDKYHNPFTTPSPLQPPSPTYVGVPYGGLAALTEEERRRLATGDEIQRLQLSRPSIIRYKQATRTTSTCDNTETCNHQQCQERNVSRQEAEFTHTSGDASAVIYEVESPPPTCESPVPGPSSLIRHSGPRSHHSSTSAPMMRDSRIHEPMDTSGQSTSSAVAVPTSSFAYTSVQNPEQFASPTFRRFGRPEDETYVSNLQQPSFEPQNQMPAGENPGQSQPAQRRRTRRGPRGGGGTGVTGEGGKKEKKRFICRDCNKEFSQLRNFRYHRSRHEGTTQFACTCPVCGKSFNDKGYLSSHLKIHKNAKEYKCEYCEKSFNQRVAYNMHVRIHTGHKPHVCPECNKAFSRKMLLRQHIRTHTGERPYKCEVCSKAFADRSNMLLHQRLHSGQRPYKCDICGKSFSKNHHLKTHLNHHAGIRPYQCEKCKACFSQSSNMKTHAKKCTGIPSSSASSNSPSDSNLSGPSTGRCRHIVSTNATAGQSGVGTGATTSSASSSGPIQSLGPSSSSSSAQQFNIPFVDLGEIAAARQNGHPHNDEIRAFNEEQLEQYRQQVHLQSQLQQQQQQQQHQGPGRSPGTFQPLLHLYSANVARDSGSERAGERGAKSSPTRRQRPSATVTSFSTNPTEIPPVLALSTRSLNIPGSSTLQPSSVFASYNVPEQDPGVSIPMSIDNQASPSGSRRHSPRQTREGQSSFSSYRAAAAQVTLPSSQLQSSPPSPSRGGTSSIAYISPYDLAQYAQLQGTIPYQQQQHQHLLQQQLQHQQQRETSMQTAGRIPLIPIRENVILSLESSNHPHGGVFYTPPQETVSVMQTGGNVSPLQGRLQHTLQIQQQQQQQNFAYYGAPLVFSPPRLQQQQQQHIHGVQFNPSILLPGSDNTSGGDAYTIQLPPPPQQGAESIGMQQSPLQLSPTRLQILQLQQLQYQQQQQQQPLHQHLQLDEQQQRQDDQQQQQQRHRSPNSRYSPKKSPKNN